MPLPDINFKNIREHEGSRDRAFEELCCQLAAVHWVEGDEHHRKGPGADAGVECFTRSAAGRETGWQVKYYWKMDASLTGSLDGSIASALTKHPDLDRYIVCIPFDLPDPRTGKSSAIKTWNTWRLRWMDNAKSMGRELTIELWTASTLKQQLIADEEKSAGRILFWFDERVLTAGWFATRFKSVKDDLGSRYTVETSVTLPIRSALLGLARDPVLAAKVDAWVADFAEKSADAIRSAESLAAESGGAIPPEWPSDLEQARRELAAPLPSPAEAFPLEGWRCALARAEDIVTNAYRCFREMRSPSTAPIGERLDAALRAFHRLGESIRAILEALDDPWWSLINSRRVLVHGPGGIGKSHLLADVVAHQLDRGRPAVMLLGQHFIDDDPWPQIVRRLDLPLGTTADQFLGAMDAAAQAAGTRALIIIDALNEKHGVRLWHDRLSGFLRALEEYRNLAVVLSCRSTYLARVIPDTLDPVALPRLQHHGFGVNDARTYLATRRIVLPGAPVPGAGFENPLFLKSCCDALEMEGRREFPRGLQGPTASFNFYRTAVTKQVDRRLSLDARRNLVGRAIDTLAAEMAKTANEYVPVAKVLELFDGVLPSQGEFDRDLLTQLESEGMLAVEMVSDGQETVRFTYQRFSDHVIAAHLITAQVDPISPALAFAPGGSLRRYVEAPTMWDHAGVLEALAVQIPERLGKELPDLVPGRPPLPVREAFKGSLLAREQRFFTARAMTLVETFLGHEEVLPTLLQVTGEEGNPYNALYLHDKLSGMTMPRRDAEWSAEVARLEADAAGGLIDWALECGFDPIEDKRAELSAITLTWFLTTTSRIIRDRATKSLAALMAPRSWLAMALLDRFWAVDDDYLRERLLAAVYGALLQGRSVPADIGQLALAVYEMVFAEGNPPVNALIRDHGRWIVEYGARHECLPAGVDITKARPPYRSPWPLEIVPDAVIEGYQQTFRSGVRLRDEIVSSALNDGDFARYVIDAHVRNWSPAPIGSARLPTSRDLYDDWRADFQASASSEAKAEFARLLECEKAAHGQGRRADTPEREALAAAKDAFRAHLTEEEWADYRSRSGMWRGDGMFNYWSHSAACFDFSWARRWVCMRAHTLGWSEELHGENDLQVHRSGRSPQAIERIGKKYQWLALYELGARLADNCAFIGDRYDQKPTGCYDGESFGSLRDVDPTLFVRTTHDDGWSGHSEPTWWAPILPTFRPMSNEDRIRWLYSEQDIINGLPCIEVTDLQGRRWLTLDGFVSVTESNRGGAESQRDSWCRLSCVVTRKRDLKRVVTALLKERLQDPHALPSLELYSHSYYFGEYPWHPAVAALGDWQRFGSKGRGRDVNIRPTTGEYTCERGSFDHSIDDTVHITLPAPWLVQSLGLRLSDGRRATYVDGTGTVLFFDPALAQDGPRAGLVERDSFLRMLEDAGLAAVWVAAGEKSVHGAMHNDGFGGEQSFAAIYWREDGGEWKNRTATDFLAPTAEQVQRLFDGTVPPWVKIRDD